VRTVKRRDAGMREHGRYWTNLDHQEYHQDNAGALSAPI
jgi:hypothetical protein